MGNLNYHIPVLKNEVLDLLVTNLDGNYLDCTFGGGGHSRAILEKISAKGQVLGTDRDDDALKNGANISKDFPNFTVRKSKFSEIVSLEEIMYGLKFDGILLDLGVSSYQLDERKRGFTYRDDAPLDMRMDKQNSLTASVVVNNYSFTDLRDIFFKYGEEKKSSKIANAIIESREKQPLTSTGQLKEIINKFTPVKFQVKAQSRIFQAIRIEVNSELQEIEDFLSFVLDILNPGGRLGVISYHSLEDRIIKKFIAKQSRGCLCPKEYPVCLCHNKPKVKKITRKPVVATKEELEYNSRSRSAKFRVCEKIG